MDFTGKSIVVTGASSGIGGSGGQFACAEGRRVFALSRRAQTGRRHETGAELL